MTPLDTARFAARALTGFRLRTSLMLVAMAIGVAAVVMLTALGEGARRYVVDEFASLGTNLLIVLPGRSETSGGAPPMLAETPRDLTLDDAAAISRSRRVRRVAPITVGTAEVSSGRRNREVLIIGATSDYARVRELSMGQGRFLPEGDPRREAPVAVLGPTVRDEIFGTDQALGQWLRIADRRFRVIGVLAEAGQQLGVVMDEVVIIPVASAQALFDTTSLFRVMVEARTRESLDAAREDVRRIVRERHEGEEDVTVITQDAVLATFDRILRALTWTVAGIAGIGLVVAGILIMNVMLIAVTQRTAEIGLLKAVGAPGRQIVQLFLAEAAALSVSGGVIGVALGLGTAWLAGRLWPVLPLAPPWWAVLAALMVALVTGLLFGWLPARRAARLDPVMALSRR